jgi:flagellar basal-body rod modification protein FlgD
MATSSVTSSVSSTTSATTSSLFSGKESSLGKEDFLKLLIEQIKNQDPLEPQENSDYVAQLATFSSLEQQMSMSDQLATLSLLDQGIANAQVLTMVGKQATVKGDVVTTDGNGTATNIMFTLGSKSTKTTVTISDSSGTVVRSLELGAKNAGVVTLNWDGKNAAGNLQPKGSYNITVKATNSSGSAVPVDTQTVGIIDAVSYSNGYAEVELDNGASAPVSDLLRVENPPSGS